MINKIIALSLLSFSAIGSSAIASEYSGFRAGSGFAETSTNTGGLGLGIKAEGGYDLNRFIGFSLSLEGSAKWGDGSIWGSQSTTTFKIGSDIGYAIKITNMLTIKPYLDYGYVDYSQTYIGWGDVESDLSGSYSGGGIRAYIGEHIYIDLSHDDVGELSQGSLKQNALTFGYKF